MADYSVTVAKLTKLMGDLDVSDERILASIEDMGQRAEQMIRVAIDAFADRDLEKARSLNELDELIDRANRNATDDVLSLGDSPEEREYGLRMLVDLPLRRADRRPRRRHRRAGRLPRHGRAPRAHRRVPPGLGAWVRKEHGRADRCWRAEVMSERASERVGGAAE